MPRRIAENTLNATTLDILNVIRENALSDYQEAVPKVTDYHDIPKVGEALYGHPAIANQFLNALVNRIAIYRVQSATFNNPYSRMKKGYLEFGETIEDIFVGIMSAVYYTPEDAEKREFKRTLPDVRSVFHIMNWRVMYPVTIQDEDLKQAFLSMEGVQNLIAKIVDSVYTGAEYDEFLLFKYLIIKAASHGKIRTMNVDPSEFTNNAIAFRGTSNMMEFMLTEYNDAGVKTNTPKGRQVIFMDAMFNAKYDVDILSAAFNMDKATFMGSLYLIDSFQTFDNERFQAIREQSDGIEEVTQAELDALANVKAIIFDENWFQVYDNKNQFTEKYVASGLYWNYFYHTWKTISCSPYANAVMFVESADAITGPASITLNVDDVSTSDIATVVTFSVVSTTPEINPTAIQFTQTEALTQAGIAVQKYGALLIPESQASTAITLEGTVYGQQYKASTTVTASVTPGTTITMSQVASSSASTSGAGTK